MGEKDMKLYFVRHGESEANTGHVISNRESPFGLTERGRDQARALSDKLNDIPFGAIFSSPVLRARETADILSQSLQVTYQVTEALREYDCGILEEKSDEESWRWHRHFYDSWTLHHNYLNRPEGGESFVDIQRRFLPFIDFLRQQGGDPVLLVGHGGLFNLMLPLILSNIDDEFVSGHWIGNTESIIAELQGDGLFVCRQWCDTIF
jgi:probable phosphoglycerate mutase